MYMYFPCLSKFDELLNMLLGLLPGSSWFICKKRNTEYVFSGIETWIGEYELTEIVSCLSLISIVLLSCLSNISA